jgi:hypothetical protein
MEPDKEYDNIEINHIDTNGDTATNTTTDAYVENENNNIENNYDNHNDMLSNKFEALEKSNIAIINAMTELKDFTIQIMNDMDISKELINNLQLVTDEILALKKQNEYLINLIINKCCICGNPKGRHYCKYEICLENELSVITFGKRHYKAPVGIILCDKCKSGFFLSSDIDKNNFFDKAYNLYHLVYENK